MARKRTREKSRERNRRRKRIRNPLREVDLFLRTTFDSIVPGKSYKRRCKRLIQKIRGAITSAYKKSEVVVYGSNSCGIALPHSDIDIGIKTETRKPLYTIRRITRVLKRIGVMPGKKLWENYIPVPGGTVLVYFSFCEDVESKIRVDVSLNNPMAPLDAAFVKAVVNFHFMNKMFLVLIKYFAICQRLNEKEDGLPNSGHVLLGIHILQKNNVIPRFLNQEQITDLNELVRESKSYDVGHENFLKSSATVASLLIDYFRYYSEEFDYTEMAISIRGSCLVTKQSLGWPNEENGYRLAIVQPFSGHNAGKRVTVVGLEKIKRAFAIARKILASESQLERLFQPFDFTSIGSLIE